MATKTMKAEPASAIPTAAFGVPMTRLMSGPMEALLQWQADALKAAEPVMMGWLERRRDATAATLETIEKLGRCTDLSEAAQVQGEWIDGVLKRLNADLQTLTEHAMALSQEAVSLTRRAAHSAAEMPLAQKPRGLEKTAEVTAAA